MKGWYYLKNCYIKGPKGRERLGVVYLATFKSDKIEGIEVLENMWISLTRKEIDAQNILELDTNNNLIAFNKNGTYKVTIILYGYCKTSKDSFDENKDFISIGLRGINTDNIYVGASQWIKFEKTLEELGIEYKVIKPHTPK